MEQHENATSSVRWVWGTQIAVALWSLVMLGHTIVTRIRHDYGWYLEQWNLVLAGEDPWSTVADNGNAYGPIHTVLAYLTPVQPLAPKVLMGALFLASNFLLVRALLQRYPQPNSTVLALYVLLVPLNALVVVSVFRWGDNDALVASLLGFAVFARFRGYLVWVGILLGLAVLVKYYPALLIPFFCLDKRRISWAPLFAASTTVLFGLLLTWLKWGTAFVQALAFGADRRPNLMSVFVYVEAQLGDTWLANLIHYNSLLITGVVVATSAAAYALRLSWIEGAVIAMLSVLFVYKIGHTQFYVPWIILLVGLLIAGSPRSIRLLYVFMPLVIYLSAYQSLFSWYWDSHRLFPDGAFLFAKSWIPAFSLTLVTLGACYGVILFGLRSMGRDEADHLANIGGSVPKWPQDASGS